MSETPKLTLVKTPEPLRGLPAYIYRTDRVDCSAGGISSRYDRVIVVGPNVPPVFAVTDDSPAVEVGTVTFLGRTSYHLRPAGESGKRYMFGGTFIHSTDSRFRALFPFGGAVAFHDRHEG